MAGWDPKETLDAVGLGQSRQKRSVRVAEVIRNEISMLLLGKVRDPKLINVSISRIELSDDLKYARVFFTVLGDEHERAKASTGLQRARGFIRSHLAKTMNLRYTPALQFRYDETAEKVEEMEKLFQEIANERQDEERVAGTDDS